MGFYTISDLTELASRVNAFATASWCFFTSGFLPPQLWGVLAVFACLASILFAMENSEPLLSGPPRHGLAFHSPLQAFSPSTCRCELGASEIWDLLELLALGSPWRVELCTFSLFFFFAWCVDTQILHKWIE